MGRTFLPEEDETENAVPVVILSHRVWEQRFDSDAEVLGQTVFINDRPFTVVGIAPEGFTGLSTIMAPDVWVPTMMVDQAFPYPVNLDGRGDPWLTLVGRLDPGVSPAQAQDELDRLAAPKSCRAALRGSPPMASPSAWRDMSWTTRVFATPAEKFIYRAPHGDDGLSVCMGCQERAQCCNRSTASSRTITVSFDTLKHVDPSDPPMAKRFKAIMTRRPSVERMIKRLKCDLGDDRLSKRGNDSFQAYLDKTMISYHLLIRHLH